MKQQLPSRGIAFLLAFFLGGLGIHQLYLGNSRDGVVWLLAAILLCWTGLPILLWFIALFQGLSYLAYSKENWAKRFE